MAEERIDSLFDVSAILKERDTVLAAMKSITDEMAKSTVDASKQKSVITDAKTAKEAAAAINQVDAETKKLSNSTKKLSDEQNALNRLNKTLVRTKVQQSEAGQKVVNALDRERAELKAISFERQKAIQQERSQADYTRAFAKELDIASMNVGEMQKELARLNAMSFKGLDAKQIATVKARMAELTDGIGDFQTRVKVASTDAIPSVTNALSGLVGIAQGVTGTFAIFGVENKKLEQTMVGLISVSMALKAAQEMHEGQVLKVAAATIKQTYAKANLTIATWAQNKADTASSGITKSLFTLLAKNPYLAIAAAVAVVTAGVIAMVIALQKEKDIRVQLSEEHKKAIKNTTQEFSNVRQLQAVLKSNTASYQDKTAAIQKLKEIMPGYNAQLSDSGKLLWQNTNAIRAYTAQLYNKIKLELAESKAKPLIESQIEAAEKLKILLPDLAKGSATVTDAFGKQTKIMIDEATGTILEYRDAIDYFDTQTGKMVKGASGWAPLVSTLDGELGNLTATYIEFGKQVTALLDIPVVANVEPITAAYTGSAKEVTTFTKEIEKMGIIFGKVIPEMERQIESAPENYKDAATSIEELKGSFEGLNYLLNNELITPDEWAEYWKKLTNIALEKSEKIKESFLSITDSAMKGFSAFVDWQNTKGDAQIQIYERQQSDQQDILEQRLAAGYITQAQYDAQTAALEEAYNAKRIEIERQQAQRSKALAVFDVSINTAKAIMEIWGAYAANIPLALAFSALAATTGAFQLAAINAQPLPGYAHGRDGGDAEFAYTGEQGTEAIVANGNVFFTPPTSTLTYLPAGASVIPAPQTASMIESGFFTNSTESLSLQKLDDIEKAIRNKREFHVNITDKGVGMSAKQAANFINYINRNARI